MAKYKAIIYQRIGFIEYVDAESMEEAEELFDQMIEDEEVTEEDWELSGKQEVDSIIEVD